GAAAGPYLVHQQFLEIGCIFRAGGECRFQWLCCLRHGAISFLVHFRFGFSSTAFGAGCFAATVVGNSGRPAGSLRPPPQQLPAYPTPKQFTQKMLQNLRPLSRYIRIEAISSVIIPSSSRTMF